MTKANTNSPECEWKETGTALPNPVICRAKINVPSDLTECLVDRPSRCRFAGPFGYNFSCYNPKKLEIVKRTEAAKKKNPGTAGISGSV